MDCHCERKTQETLRPAMVYCKTSVRDKCNNYEPPDCHGIEMCMLAQRLLNDFDFMSSNNNVDAVRSSEDVQIEGRDQVTQDEQQVNTQNEQNERETQARDKRKQIESELHNERVKKIQDHVGRACRNERLHNYFRRRKFLVFIRIPQCESVQFVFVARPSSTGRGYLWSARVYNDCDIGSSADVRSIIDAISPETVLSELSISEKGENERKPPRVYYEDDPVELGSLLRILRHNDEFDAWDRFYNDQSFRHNRYQPPHAQQVTGTLQIEIDGVTDCIGFQFDESIDGRALRELSHHSGGLWLDPESMNLVSAPVSDMDAERFTRFPPLRIVLERNRFFDFLFYHLHARLS